MTTSVFFSGKLFANWATKFLLSLSNKTRHRFQTVHFTVPPAAPAPRGEPGAIRLRAEIGDISLMAVRGFFHGEQSVSDGFMSKTEQSLREKVCVSVLNWTESTEKFPHYSRTTEQRDYINMAAKRRIDFNFYDQHETSSIFLRLNILKKPHKKVENAEFQRTSTGFKKLFCHLLTSYNYELTSNVFHRRLMAVAAG